MTHKRRSNWSREIFWTKPTSSSILQDLSMLRSGCAPSMPSCSGSRTRSCRSISRITLRSFLIQRTGMLHMLTKRERGPPCLLTRLWIAITLRWLSVSSTPRISWHTCLTTTSSRIRWLWEATPHPQPSIAPHQAQQECSWTRTRAGELSEEATQIQWTASTWGLPFQTWAVDSRTQGYKPSHQFNNKKERSP